MYVSLKLNRFSLKGVWGAAKKVKQVKYKITEGD